MTFSAPIGVRADFLFFKSFKDKSCFSGQIIDVYKHSTWPLFMFLALMHYNPQKNSLSCVSLSDVAGYYNGSTCQLPKARLS